MKKLSIIVLSVLFFYSSNILHAQVDTLWTKCYGGANVENYLAGIDAAPSIDINDNGEIYITSNTNSTDKYVSGNNGELDCWVIKLNSTGDTLWTKILGGNKNDLPRDILALDDGGCLVVGNTYSNSGDFTGHHGTDENPDGFIVRLDSIGNTLWIKQYGGAYVDGGSIFVGYDILTSVIQTKDGNFLVAGESASIDGDLPYDGQKFHGGWILKVDGNGTIITSKKIVSAKHKESVRNSIAKIVELSDGSGYATIGEVLPPGDAWITKLDNSFSKVWEKEYGGSMGATPIDIIEAEQGNLICTGNLNFGAGGDVTVPYLGGLYDPWIFKLDSKGTIIDQAIFGGSSIEISYSLNQDNKGNYLMTALTHSTDSFAHGGYEGGLADFWLINFDSNLDTLWTFKFGGEAPDALTQTVCSKDGNYIYAVGKTDSDSGYVVGNNGFQDNWIGKINNPSFRKLYMICGDSVTLIPSVADKGSASATYAWSPATGLTNTSIFNPKVSPINTTTYYLTITDGNTVINDSVVVIVDPLTVNAGSDMVFYCTDTSNLQASANLKEGVSFAWSPTNGLSDTLINNPKAFPDSTITYVVSATTLSGCIATDDMILNQNYPVQINRITKLLENNKIGWIKPSTSSIDSIHIYRKNINSGIYEKLNTLSFDGNNYYIDTDSPDTSSEYKISTYACGSENMSQSHKTIHLSSDFSENAGWNLKWNAYEGFSPKAYYIYRSTSKYSEKSLIGTSYGSVYTFKDVSATEGDQYYQVVAMNPDTSNFDFTENSTKSNFVYVNFSSAQVSIKDNSIEELPETDNIYHEGFEADTLSSSIIRIDYDSIAPEWVSWEKTEDYYNDANSVMITTSAFGIPEGVDDWLITPQISLDKSSLLSWRALSFYGGPYLESYEVRISTTGTDTKDFTEIVYASTGENDKWTTRVANLEKYTNEDIYVAIRYTSNNKLYFFIDDITIFTVDSIVDASVASANMQEYVYLDSVVIISGSFSNFGNESINSIDVNWSIDGGTVYTDSYSNLEIDPFFGYDFVCSDNWTPSSSGEKTIKIWTSNINGAEDENHSNDTLSKAITVMGYIPPKYVLMEEFTGSWCGWCPDGAVKMIDLTENNPNVIGVAIHGNDAMVSDDGNTILDEFGGSYPSGVIDRVKFGVNDVALDRSKWEEKVNERLLDMIPIEVKATKDYNPATRALKVTVTTTFYEEYSGDLRLNCYIVEDSVSGEGQGYDQANYLNASIGHPMEGKGDPVIGYQHRHVLRDMLGGAWGKTGVIPATAIADSSYSYTFVKILNSEWKEERISMVAVVQNYNSDNSQREILNAYEIHIDESRDSGIKDEISSANNGSIKIYPNPVKEITTLEMNLSQQQQVIVNIYDLSGRVVMFKFLGHLNSADNHKTTLSTGNLEKGIYLLEVKGEYFSSFKKIVVAE